MTEREAIEILSRPFSMQEAPKEILDAHRLAISALEKQTPRTVRTEYDRRHNYFLHFCPVCGGLTREYEYCSECGQKLSYEEEQEE